MKDELKNFLELLVSKGGLSLDKEKALETASHSGSSNMETIRSRLPTMITSVGVCIFR